MALATAGKRLRADRMEHRARRKERERLGRTEVAA